MTRPAPRACDGCALPDPTDTRWIAAPLFVVLGAVESIRKRPRDAQTSEGMTQEE